MFFFFFSLNGDTRNLHVRTPSSPSRRSSDPLSQSHTGAIAGNNAASDAYFYANGVMRIEMLESLFEAAPLASRYAAARPQSRSTQPTRVAVITTTGGGAASVVDSLGLKNIEAATPPLAFVQHMAGKSEERRVGQECVCTCRSRGSPGH